MTNIFRIAFAFSLILLVIIGCLNSSLTAIALTPEELSNIEVKDEQGRQITVEYFQPTGEWQALADGNESFYTGLVPNKYGVWFCSGGRVKFDFTGLVEYEDDSWYVVEGKVATDYSGVVEDEMGKYTIENGKVVKTSLTKQGWQYSLGTIAFVAILVGLFIVRRRNTKKRARMHREKEIAIKKETEEALRQEKIEKAQHVYREEVEGANLSYQKAEFLTAREKEFYPYLKAVSDKLGYTVSMKPRLGDIVTGADNEYSSQGMKERNKVWKKHVDFALFDPSDMALKLIIELDDTTHERQSRVNRDVFVDNVLEKTGYKILHVYNEKNLEEKIRNKLAE